MLCLHRHYRCVNMYPVLDAFEGYLDRKCGFVSYTLLQAGFFWKKNICNSHSYKNHPVISPNSGASKCICGVGCGAQWNIHGTSAGWPSLGWWKTWPLQSLVGDLQRSRDEKGYELNHLALFQHDFSWGVVFLGVLLNGSWNLSQRRCSVCRARGVTMTSHDVEAAMQELSPKLLKQIELGKE